MNNHIGSNFDTFLKSEGVEIQDKEVKEILKAYKKLFSEKMSDIEEVIPPIYIRIDDEGNLIELTESEVQE